MNRQNSFFNEAIWDLPIVFEKINSYELQVNNDNFILWGLNAEELTACSTLALVVVGFVTAFILVCQTRILINQNRELEKSVRLSAEHYSLTHRAWIKCKAELYTLEDVNNKSPLHFESETLAVSLKFTFENTGNLPATNTYVSYKICINEHSSKLFFNVQKEISDQLRNRNLSIQNGSTIFPGEQDEIILSKNIQLPKINKYSDFLNEDDGYPELFSIKIIGCVDYRSSLGAVHHQSKFAYLICTTSDYLIKNKIHTSQMQTSGNVIPKTDIPLEKLFLHRMTYLEGNLFDAN